MVFLKKAQRQKLEINPRQKTWHVLAVFASKVKLKTVKTKG